MTHSKSDPTVRLRIVLGPDIAFGPGKADLLDGIRETGSIAAAGRRMGMSYKRAWTLIETLNRNFSRPLVETSKGGSERGGAVLTEAGEAALALYRQMEARAVAEGVEDVAALKAMLATGKP
jgi:molybdate transport system regulatory protein